MTDQKSKRPRTLNFGAADYRSEKIVVGKTIGYLTHRKENREKCIKRPEDDTRKRGGGALQKICVFQSQRKHRGRQRGDGRPDADAAAGGRVHVEERLGLVFRQVQVHPVLADRVDQLRQLRVVDDVPRVAAPHGQRGPGRRRFQQVLEFRHRIDRKRRPHRVRHRFHVLALEQHVRHVVYVVFRVLAWTKANLSIWGRVQKLFPSKKVGNCEEAKRNNLCTSPRVPPISFSKSTTAF